MFKMYIIIPSKYISTNIIVYMCVNTLRHIYRDRDIIYIYIYRKRERNRERESEGE